MPRKTQIQVRRDTASNWTTVNPVLASGEIGFETNTNKMKIGDGTTVWTSLSYAGGSGGSYTLPAASSTVLGGTKLFSDTVQSVAASAVSSTASRTYGTQLNASGQLVVNVPWTDTTGFVTSVSGTGTVSGLTLTGTVTSSGNLTLGGTLSVVPSNFANQTANLIFAGPASGSAAAPSFRQLAAADFAGGASPGQVPYVTTSGTLWGWITPITTYGYIGSTQTTSASNGILSLSGVNTITPSANFSTTPSSTTTTGYSVSIVGGPITGTTGTAGQLNITGGAVTTGSTGSATGGAVVITGGSSSNGLNGTGGNVRIDAGTGASGNGDIGIGGTNASGVSIGRAGISTNINGPVGFANLYGTAGQVLTSGGAAASPTWTNWTSSSSIFFFTANATTTLANNTNAQSPFGLTTGISLISGYVYDVEVYIQGTCGSTSGQLQFLGALGSGTQTLYSSGFRTASVPATLEGRAHTSTSTLGAATSASVGTVFYLTVRGKVVATANTTWNPQIGFSVATGTAPTTSAGSYVRVTPVATSATPLNIGSWS